jgi:hypothetical protein
MRPFSVYGANHRVIGWVRGLLCAALILASVVFVVLGVTVGHGNADMATSAAGDLRASCCFCLP